MANRPKPALTPSDKAAHKEMMENSYFQARQKALWSSPDVSKMRIPSKKQQNPG